VRAKHEAPQHTYAPPIPSPSPRPFPEGEGDLGAGHPPTLRAGEPPAPQARYYQLTHDYLVPSLREWFTRKQKQTRRGRAELRLAERAAQWNAKPENRRLPAWWEFLNIRLLAPKRYWTARSAR